MVGRKRRSRRAKQPWEPMGNDEKRAQKLAGLSALMFAPSVMAAPKPINLLVFEFPDGARGGNGKIKGLGKQSAEDLPGSSPKSLYLEIIRRCGAKDARDSDYQVTHRSLVVAKITKKDRDIVACVMKNSPFRFSVWVGSPKFTDNAKDESAFREFWESPATGRYGP
jgi:hypothetical protein